MSREERPPGGAPAPSGDGGRRSGPRWRLETRATRVGKRVELSRGEPASAPLIFSSAYAQPDSATIDAIFAGDREGYVYSRYGNPTVAALEEAIADLEGAEACAAYGSGMAAVAGAFAALGLGRGAKVVASAEIYGSCVTWLEDAAETRGWELGLVAGGSRALVDEVARVAPDVTYCEVLSNPLVRLVDLDALAETCAAGGSALIVDATFTPPPLIRALEHGATLVLHSATKYLGGHGDLTAGVLSGPADLVGAARERRKLEGNIADPFSAWLVLRGLRTLAIRVERQCDNAREVARFLAGHPRVARVHYPGLDDRDTGAERQVLSRLFPHGRHGAMVAFDIAGGGASGAARLLDSLELWGRATTLGDLESLALIPASTSHRPLSAERRAALGISDATVRLSVGIEHVDDLVADLDRALQASA